MWSWQLQFQKNKGFTLIEFILSISLMSIVLISIFSLLQYANMSLDRSDDMEEVLLNGRYGLEYIKGEVLSADRLVSSSKFKNLDRKYPTNIGFVIMKENGNLYKFITYYKKNNELIRISCEKALNNYPSESNFKGFNQICTNLIDLGSTYIDTDKELLNLYLDMGVENKSMMEFKSTIYIRCLMDF